MIEVTVARLGLDSATNAYVVILREKGGTRLLPIWIGQAEAESIVLEMNHVKRERPLTHDLCKSLIVGLGGTLRRVQITRVKNSTYFAEMHIVREDGVVHIDARPSDSIAVALRLGAPLYVEEALLAGGSGASEEGDDDDDSVESGGVPKSPPDPDAIDAQQLKERLERLRPEDFGKFNL